jgi:hypothetical protein
LRGRDWLGSAIRLILRENSSVSGCLQFRKSNSGRFAELIRWPIEQTGQRAVVLIDEYDKPILDNLKASGHGPGNARWAAGPVFRR